MVLIFSLLLSFVHKILVHVFILCETLFFRKIVVLCTLVVVWNSMVLTPSLLIVLLAYYNEFQYILRLVYFRFISCFLQLLHIQNIQLSLKNVEI